MHHVDAGAPVAELRVDPAVTDVLMIVHHEGAVVGQAWLRPQDGTIPAQRLRAAMRECSGEAIARRQARGLVETALGRPRPEPHEPRRSVAVVVCTRDRADQLAGCLESLRRLRRPGVELLVVDNGSSTSATAELCDRLGVRCVSEPQPGQTRARNRGIAETTAELIAFTDDDVIVDEHWLDGLDEVFDDPLTMIATGYIGPFELEHESQVQFEAHGGFERRADRQITDAGRASAMAGAAAVGAGANMVVRRELFEAIGGFDVDFGAGTQTRTSDDKLFYYRALEAGFRIEYDPARIVWHQHRRDDKALRRIMRDYGTGEFTWTTHILRTRRDLEAVKHWRWWIVHFAKDVWRRARGRQSGVPLWVTREEIAGVAAAPRALRSVRDGVHGPPRDVFVPGAVGGEQPQDASVTAETPPVTAALASYNRRERLERALRALGEQRLDRERYEVVVVLDGCTDGSGEMVRSLDVPYPIRLIEQPNSGLAVGRNRGAREASHPLVVFLDDDIEARPELLAEHALAHARAGEDSFVMGYFPPLLGSSWVEQELRFWWLDHFRRKAQPGHRWTLNDVVDGNSSIPVRALERVGWFDEDFSGGRRQDYELGVRLLRAGIPLAFNPRARGDHFPSATFETMLNNGFEEGRYDALLVSKHPHVYSQTPLARLPVTGPLGRKAKLAQQLGRDRCIALARRFEQLGRRRQWRGVLNNAWVAEYVAGARSGLAAAGFTLPPTPERTRVEVALGNGSVPIADPGASDLVAVLDGRALAPLRAVLPGAQWDWDDVVGRMTEEVVEERRREGKL